jgi:prepilin-type N-terminal cleavage/methylation domain-containing protein
VGGFSLLEVIIALAVLVIGVCSLAALSALSIGRGRQSKYTAMAGTLASEKLEDLNRWTGSFNASGTDVSDPQICVPNDVSSGGLGSDTTNASVVCDNSVGESISYFDNVSIDVTNASDCPNAADGCFAESYSQGTGSSTTYYTTYHSPDGTIPGSSTGSPVAATTQPTNLTFHRRWMIEANPTINGVQFMNVRRITVLVYATDPSTSALVTSTPPPIGVSFQMSMVRP